MEKGGWLIQNPCFYANPSNPYTRHRGVWLIKEGCCPALTLRQKYSHRIAMPSCGLKRVAVISAKNHKRQRRMRQSVTAK